MRVMHDRVAAIDVHKDMVKVAIRSPGEKPWTRTTEIVEFRTFYGVLQEMAQPVRQAQQGPGHGRVGLHFLQPPPRMVLIGDPDAAHQLGLADI